MWTQELSSPVKPSTSQGHHEPLVSKNCFWPRLLWVIPQSFALLALAGAGAAVALRLIPLFLRGTWWYMRGLRWEAQVDWPTLSPSHSNEISGGGENRGRFLKLPAHIILIGWNRIGKTLGVLMMLLKNMEFSHRVMTKERAESTLSLKEGHFLHAAVLHACSGLHKEIVFTTLIWKPFGPTWAMTVQQIPTARFQNVEERLRLNVRSFQWVFDPQI